MMIATLHSAQLPCTQSFHQEMATVTGRMIREDSKLSVAVFRIKARGLKTHRIQVDVMAAGLDRFC